MPLWSWPNLLSLDAIAVGLLWQLAFAIEFCGRSPSWPESGIVGLTIWLAYTADRLLDSARLDLSRPHTLRHRLHLEKRNYLVGVWIVALAIDTAVVVVYATESQIRWGCVAIAIVLAYVARVHLARQSRWRLPKELQAGMVFAFGVSLLPWSEVNDKLLVPLLLSTLLAGFLFAANCFAVAQWENDLDSNQGFSSWVTSYPASPRWLPIALIWLLMITAMMYMNHFIPLLITTCLIASNLLLLVVVLVTRGRGTVTETCRTSVRPPSPYGLIADAALVIPPMMWVVTGAFVR